MSWGIIYISSLFLVLLLILDWAVFIPPLLSFSFSSALLFSKLLFFPFSLVLPPTPPYSSLSPSISMFSSSLTTFLAFLSHIHCFFPSKNIYILNDPHTMFIQSFFLIRNLKLDSRLLKNIYLLLCLFSSLQSSKMSEHRINKQTSKQRYK